MHHPAHDKDDNTLASRRATVAGAAHKDSQRRVAAALAGLGHEHLAGRLRNCLEVRRGRGHGAPWPWRCRSAGCVRCLARASRRWWAGIAQWAFAEERSSGSVLTVRISLGGTAPLAGAARLRRGLRDARDRAARRDRRWAAVALAGFVGEGEAVLAVLHPGLPAEAVERLLRRRWPTAIVEAGVLPEVGTLRPLDDAALVALALRRRGTEPLRIVVAPQMIASNGSDANEMPCRSADPMPIVLGGWGPWA